MNNENPAIIAALADRNESLVRINPDVIAQLPPQQDLGAMPSTLQGTDLAGRPPFYVPYLLAMNTLNFQFWSLEGGGLRRYEQDGKIGALAMQDAFMRSWHHAANHTDGGAIDIARSLRQRVLNEGIKYMFGQISDQENRAKVLLDILQPEKFLDTSNRLTTFLQSTRKFSWRDAAHLAEEYPVAYGDRYLKKAQLTLMFIAAEWNFDNPNDPVHLDVSAAADYQLPKVLRKLGIITYGEDLARKVDSMLVIPKDGAEERAIRSATLLACEALAEHFECTIEAVDFWLWGNRNQAKDAKFHLTRTTDY